MTSQSKTRKSWALPRRNPHTLPPSLHNLPQISWSGYAVNARPPQRPLGERAIWVPSYPKSHNSSSESSSCMGCQETPSSEALRSPILSSPSSSFSHGIPITTTGWRM